MRRWCGSESHTSGRISFCCSGYWLQLRCLCAGPQTSGYGSLFGDGHRITDDRATGLALITYVTLTGKPTGASFFLDGTSYGIMMAFTSGIITSVPLVLFHIGNRYLPLSVAGFLFYLNPSLQLLLGLLIFRRDLYKCGYGGLYVDLAGAGLQFAPDRMAYSKPSLSNLQSNLLSER